jgi:hypothetical protein
MPRIALIAVLALSLSGCFSTTIRTRATRDLRRQGEDTGASFAWGLSPVTASAIECENGIAEARVYWPFWGGLVSIITAGIVTPIKTEYVCAEAPKPE